jgi:hypothetical protein
VFVFDVLCCVLVFAFALCVAQLRGLWATSSLWLWLWALGTFWLMAKPLRCWLCAVCGLVASS